MKNVLYVVFLITNFGFSQELTLQQANYLAGLPLKCLQQEYPNKLSQTLADASELAGPQSLHPAFYGCFDWHSSVHGHWSLVYLLNHFSDLKDREIIISKLMTNLSKENIQAEINYFTKKHEKSYERMYGWSWLLKLQLELESSKDTRLLELAKNLQPLSHLLIERYQEFLPKLLYPVRVGTHTNTAFGLTFAWDYAVFAKNELFQRLIRESAVRWFQNDENCPLQWEPSGTDFFSPCLEEIGLMNKVLDEKEFLRWVKRFAKPLFEKKFQWDVAKVSDRGDGHLVHLDGLNFSRAWHFYALAKQYPKQFAHLRNVADKHFQYSLPMVVDGNYEGEHWLASFALRTFEVK